MKHMRYAGAIGVSFFAVWTHIQLYDDLLGVLGDVTDFYCFNFAAVPNHYMMSTVVSLLSLIL